MAWRSDALIDLGGLEALSSVGDVRIESNPVLADISGLASIAQIGADNAGPVSVTDNPQLDSCAVSALFTPIDGWSGALTNTNNLTCSGTCVAGECQ